jgi:hypothetical protein
MDPIPVKLNCMEYMIFKLHFPFVDPKTLCQVCMINGPTYLELIPIDDYDKYLERRRDFPIYFTINGLFWENA